MSEEETLVSLLGGYRGCARYGDGDFNVMRGRPDRFHVADPGLAWALAETLARPTPGVLQCLIPPPTGSPTSLGRQRWHHYLEVNAGLIPLLPFGQYGSANISRMDSVPHLHSTSWWRQVSMLWQDKPICLVAGTTRSLSHNMLLESPGAPRSVTSVSCAPTNNFKELESMRARVLETGVETVLLCAGLTTRPLVHKLVADGVKAYDLGHLGQWFSRGMPIPLQDCPR